MIEQIELGHGMHSRNEYQSSGSMHMMNHPVKPHMHHQTGFMSNHQSGGYGGYSSGMHHQHHMGHYGGPNMSSTSMNSSHYSNGGMFGGSDMARTEYDSFQKVHTPGLMHESKYHHHESSYGGGMGGYGGGMSFMPGGFGARRTEWVSKAL